MDGRIKVLLINGPNLNLLGLREPEHYGHVTLQEIEREVLDLGQTFAVDVIPFQSNHEGQIVDFLHLNGLSAHGVIINPAALTKAGYSILEALASIKVPFVEVHLSNIYARGGWHSESIFAASAIGQICGFRKDVYPLALRALISYLRDKNSGTSEMIS